MAAEDVQPFSEEKQDSQAAQQEAAQQEAEQQRALQEHAQKKLSGASDSQNEHASESERGSRDEAPKVEKAGKVELTEDDCYEALGFCFPFWKKWLILTVIFMVQMSMNFNSGVYANAVPGLTEEFHISEQAARVGQCVFLVAYAFGCELWAPWSEEFGRWPIMQLSLLLVNIWQIPCAVAPNYGTIVGMTADMWEADDQGFAVAFVVLSSVGGSTIGPFFGGFIGQYLHWPWVFWVQLIFGGFTQALHFFLVPETRSTILIDREAKRRRKSGEEVYGPNEMKEKRLDVKEVLHIWKRPFEMFLREPIVLCLSLLSGFSDALIFVFTESFTLVFGQWNMSTLAVGMTFGSILIGYIIAYFIFLPDVYRQIQIRRKEGAASRFAERRLLLLLFIAPLEPIGLLGFAWTTMGPPYPMDRSPDLRLPDRDGELRHLHGDNRLHDFLAGVATMYATPMYTNIGEKYHLQWASTILGIVGFMVMVPLYVFYWKGPEIRKRSKFAQQLAADREHNYERRQSNIASRRQSLAASRRQSQVASRRQSQVAPPYRRVSHIGRDVYDQA
ncbi:hypothetical protein N7468_003429 [Penicillium chermesinum]|uniref:Major facilitator superfamily (MFS) profile domain-containing protein n=1 Tax=Penicillium chermesinum TaxID=63820 RepID=A0A9W9TRL5_9EURO|nr:uncharacterized protein N7468_003429 [Penicillium chermesinum]KAJ5238810.1 hypothetical protein N7468_003429 [Penicillium chermesinum]